MGSPEVSRRLSDIGGMDLHRFTGANEAGGAALCQAVALCNETAHGDAQKVFHMGRQGGAAADADAHAATQARLDLGEHQPVEERRSLHEGHRHQDYVFAAAIQIYSDATFMLLSQYDGGMMSSLTGRSSELPSGVHKPVQHMIITVHVCCSQGAIIKCSPSGSDGLPCCSGHLC